MTSSIQGIDFIKKAFEIKNQNSNSNQSNFKYFEIENVPNDNSFNTKEFKQKYAKEGIHIYNYNENTEKLNGDKSKISFQIRSNINNQELKNKLERINEEVSKAGIIVKEKEEEALKPRKVLNNVPCNMKWDDVRIRNVTKRMDEYEKKIMTPRVISKKDKMFSNGVVLDYKYKNMIK